MDTGTLIVSVVWATENGEVRSTHTKVIKPDNKTAIEVIHKILDELDEISHEYY